MIGFSSMVLPCIAFVICRHCALHCAVVAKPRKGTRGRRIHRTRGPHTERSRSEDGGVQTLTRKRVRVPTPDGSEKRTKVDDDPMEGDKTFLLMANVLFLDSSELELDESLIFESMSFDIPTTSPSLSSLGPTLPSPTPSLPNIPSQIPTKDSEDEPSFSPSSMPSISPTNLPHVTPPSSFPSSTNTPSAGASRRPSTSAVPSQVPTESSSNIPSDAPSFAPSNSPSHGPTLSQSPSIRSSDSPSYNCNLDPIAREAKIFQLLSEVSDANLLRDTMTNQYRAFDWVVNFDGARVCPDDVVAVEQRYILALLYFSTNGDEWLQCNSADAPLQSPCIESSENARYLSPRDECIWFTTGCDEAISRCDALGRLTCIALDENNLAGPIPSELSSLPHLSIIDLDGNININGTIPESLGDLTKLLRIDLDENSLSGQIPESLFGPMNPLRRLDLDTNVLTGTIPTKIGLLSILDVLMLDQNMLNGTLPTELGNLFSLQFCTLESNAFTGSLPSQLGNMLNLEALNLRNNQFSGAIPETMGDLKQLKDFLALSNNALNGTIPTSLGNLKSLEILLLHGNDLSGSMPTEICQLLNGSLTVLSVDCDKVSCPCCTFCGDPNGNSTRRIESG